LGYALLLLVTGALFVVFIKPTNTTIAEGNNASRAKGSIKVFIKPNTILFYIPFAVFQIMLLCVLSYAPTAMQQNGMDATTSGFVSTLPMLLAVISSTAFGVISDKIHKCKPLILVGLFAMTITTPFMLTQVGIYLWVAVVIMGLFAMGVPTAFISAYPSILGDPRLLSEGMGVFMLVQSIGQFFGSLLPFTSPRFGFDSMVCVLCSHGMPWCGFDYLNTHM